METGTGEAWVLVCLLQIFQFPFPLFHRRFAPRSNNATKKASALSDFYFPLVFRFPFSNFCFPFSNFQL